MDWDMYRDERSYTLISPIITLSEGYNSIKMCKTMVLHSAFIQNILALSLTNERSI